MTLAINLLDTLSDEINGLSVKIDESFRHTLNYAIECGEKLIQAKIECGHGHWLKWREEHINHSQSTSQRYVTVAINKKLLLANYPKLGNMSLDVALRLLNGGTPMLQSMSNDWWTPKKYVDAARDVMGEIDLDPASTHEANSSVGAGTYYDEEMDGLLLPWYGRVFLNPPYGKLGPAFAERLYEQLGSTVLEAIILVNSRATDSAWFQPMFEGVICFTDHRIDFDSPEEKNTSSTHGSCFVYFGPNEDKFAEVFSQFGNIVKRWDNGTSA